VQEVDTMRFWTRFLTLAAAGVLLGLGAAPVRAQSTEPIPDPVPLTITLTTDGVYYRSGQPVRIKMVIRNNGVAPITLRFNTSQRYDFLVRRVPDRAVVWQWSFNRYFLLTLGAETLDPGETREVAEVWNQQTNAGQPVLTGIYRLEGIVTSFDPAPLLSNPTFIQIGLRLP
jgi:Intracellular proteinase inhibitor